MYILTLYFPFLPTVYLEIYILIFFMSICISSKYFYYMLPIIFSVPQGIIGLFYIFILLIIVFLILILFLSYAIFWVCILSYYTYRRYRSIVSLLNCDIYTLSWAHIAMCFVVIYFGRFSIIYGLTKSPWVIKRLFWIASLSHW